MHTPRNLRYTPHHLWVRPVGRNDIYVGITDFAQKELGRIESMDLQREGSLQKIGEVFGVIYGANKMFELFAPLSGRILMLNPEIARTPFLVNSDPYHFWIALFCIEEKPVYGVKILSAEEYLNLISISSN